MKKLLLIIMTIGACLMLSACSSTNVITGYSDGDVKLGQYKGVTYDGQKVEVTDEEVAEDVKSSLLETYKTNRPIEGRTVVEDGDVVILDYTGYVDGVAFDGGSQENAEIIIGQSSMIPGFCEGIVGCEIGVSKDVPVTFPEDYFNEELAGKDAVFTMLVHQICEKVEPEYTDETVATYTDYETVAEYNDYTREKLLSSRQTAADTKKQYDVFKKIIASSSFSTEALAPEIEKNRQTIVSNLNQQYSSFFGIDAATYYMDSVGMDSDEVNEYFDTMASMQTKYTFILSAVAQEEHLTASAQEIAELAERMTASYGYETQDELFKNLETFYGTSGNEVVATQVKLNKALALILDSAIANE